MRKIDFSNDRIVRNILLSAFPMLVAQVISLLYNIVDRIYIGRIPDVGTAALGAVGLCFPVTMLIAGFTNMFGLGGAPLFAMETGRGNQGKAREILNTAFRLEVIAALLITVLCEITSPALLRLFGAGEESLVYSVGYLRWYLIGTVFSMLATGINPYINAQGFASTGMLTVLIGAVSNIVLDPLFIFVFGLGVEGAAIATVLSQALSCLFVLRFLFGPKNEYRIERPRRESFLPHAWDIVGLGTAPFVMQVTNSLVSIACNNVLMNIGGVMYVSTMTIISSVRSILDTPILAITEGSSPVISYNYGARRPDYVRKAMLVMSVMAIGYTMIMWAFIEWKPELLVAIFTSDPELRAMVVRPLHLYFFAFVFQSFQYSGQTVFKALNKKRYAIFFSIFRKVVLVVPLTYALSYTFGMGTDGVFIAEPVSNLIGGIACFVTMLLTILPELRRMKKA